MIKKLRNQKNNLRDETLRDITQQPYGDVSKLHNIPFWEDLKLFAIRNLFHDHVDLVELNCRKTRVELLSTIDILRSYSIIIENDIRLDVLGTYSTYVFESPTTLWYPIC